MARKRLILAILVVALALLMVTVVSAGGSSEWTQVRRANGQFRAPAAAEAAGYSLVGGLDHCFDNPGVGAMGFHYIHTASLDLVVDPLRPEAMVYVPGPGGRLKLGAVEYIVPAEAWDAAGHAEPPTVLGQPFRLNEALGVYVLHAWLWYGNPAGTFEDWNPNVSCAGASH